MSEVGDQTISGRPSGGSTLHARLVGRGEQLNQVAATLTQWLKDAMQSERSGPPNLFLIRGPAGIGKTRLADEAAARFQRSSSVICLKLEFRNGAGLLNLASGWIHDPLNADFLAAATGTFEEHHANANAGDAQPTPYEGPGQVLEAVLTLPIASAENWLVEFLADAFRAVHSKGMHLLLVLENIQSLEGSAALLNRAIQSAEAAAPFAILATSTGELTSDNNGLAVGGNQVLKLAGLNPMQGSQLMDELLGNSQFDQGLLAERLHAEAQGSPLYYVNYAAMIANSNESPASELKSLRELIVSRIQQDPSFRAELSAAYIRNIRLYGISQSHPANLDPSTKEASGDPGWTENSFATEILLGALSEHEERALRLRAIAAIEDLLLPGSALEWELLPNLCSHLEALGDSAELHRRSCQMLALMLQARRSTNWDEWEQRARESWQQMHEDVPSPYMLRVEGLRYWLDGSLKSALSSFLEALQCDLGSDPLMHGRLHADTANCLLMQGQLGEAELHFKTADELLSRIGAEALVGVNLANYGTLLHRRGELDNARRMYELAYEIAIRHKHLRVQASLLGYLASLHSANGNADLGMPYLQRALKLARFMRDHMREASVLGEMGTAHREVSEWDAAEQHYRQCIELADVWNLLQVEALARANYAKMLRLIERRSEAQDQIELSLTLLPEDAPYLGTGLIERAMQQLDCGALNAARADLTEAVRILRACGWQPFEAVAHCCLSRISLLRGDESTARAELEVAESIYDSLGRPSDVDLLPELQLARAAMAEWENNGPAATSSPSQDLANPGGSESNSSR